RHIPVQTEILAIDVRFGSEPCNRLAERIGAHTVEGSVERDLTRLSADGEVSGHREVVARTRDTLAFEGDGWMVGDVEEVWRAEVFVSLWITGDERGDVDFGLD